jgi:hypothetical protein
MVNKRLIRASHVHLKSAIACSRGRETIEGQNPSLFALEADERGYSRIVRFVPFVDGSEFGKNILHVCSIGRCGHVFGLLARGS